MSESNATPPQPDSHPTPDQPQPRTMPAWLKTLVPIVAILVLVGVLLLAKRGQQEALVVYCAHDAIFAEEVLQRFTEQTGIPVDIRYDSEATKSLGLTEQLIAEKDNPQADVFWNNQLLGTLDLQHEGVLEPYQGAGWERIPETFRDPEGHWVGFGARLRVYIVNTDRMDATPRAITEAFNREDLSRICIAKGMYGTTLTQYAVWWQTKGEQGVKDWQQHFESHGGIVRGGNATTRDLVAQGACDLGFTDTDDFFGAKDAGHPVEMLPVRVETGQTIFIPNTVAIVKGAKRRAQAEVLVDFLTSEANEIALAHGEARQIPLGPVDVEALPEEVKQLAEWAQYAYPLGGLRDEREAALAWLKSEAME